jgi:F-type H+-transporting ATPase subunit b
MQGQNPADDRPVDVNCGGQSIRFAPGEYTKMQPSSSRVLSSGVMVLCLVFFALDRPIFAQEGHSPAAAAPEAHGAQVEHGSESPNPLDTAPGLAIWTLFVFVGLLAILTKYAWKPLIKALHDREKHLEHVLTETERARNESEANLAEHRKMMARAADEVRGIMDKARQEAQAAADSLMKHAQNEAESAKQRAQRDIASARDQALAEIWQKTADMAVTVAGRVLSKELSEGEHRRLLDAAIKELPAQAGSNGHGGKSV